MSKYSLFCNFSACSFALLAFYVIKVLDATKSFTLPGTRNNHRSLRRPMYLITALIHVSRLKSI